MSFGFSSGGVVGTAVVDKINKNIDMLTQKLQSETTNAVTKPINSYPVEKQGMIKSFLNSVDNGLNDFVERVKNGSKKFERYNISEVSAREADDIKNSLGIDVKGYTHNINSDGIRHILKRHGVNGQQDNTMSNVDDIARIAWVIENYDTVELIIEDSKQSYSTGFADKNNSPAPQIKYSKKINGTYYVVEAAFENRYTKLWVQSAYLSKNREDVTKVPDAADKPPEVTAKTALPSPPSINSLSQDGEKVNNDYIRKEANSQDEGASFFDDNSEKSTPKINPDEVISGMWEDSPNSSKNNKIENVEKSQLDIFDNNKYSIYNKSNLATTGNSGEKAKPYSTDSIPQYINQYLYKLKNYGDILNVKEPPSFSDISLMSRQSGTEFASITIGDKHYIIKGNTKGTPISNDVFEKIKDNRGTLNCHSHPFIDDFRVSKADINLAKQMYWQKEFYIVSPDGKFATYDSNGIIDIDIIKKKLDDSDYEFYLELFKED